MSVEKKDNNQKYSAPAVRKVLEMLELMAKTDHSFTLSEIVSQLDVTSNSAFRIFKELEQKGYVVKNVEDSSYELTPKIYYLGNSIRNRISFVKTAYPYMKNIRKYTKETVLLTKLTGENDTLVIDQLESMEPIKFISTVGISYDSYTSAMGKAMLSSLDEAQLKEYFKKHELVKRTQNTITSQEELEAELKVIAKKGVAFDREENLYGLSCIASPIYSSAGELVGAIGISGLSFRMTKEQALDYAEYIKDQAKMLSSTLGY